MEETWESACAEHLKLEINNLLWTYLPPDMTLGNAESFACEIFERIRDEWEKRDGCKPIQAGVER